MTTPLKNMPHISARPSKQPTDCIIIGKYNSVNHPAHDTVVLGSGITTDESNMFVVGVDGVEVLKFYREDYRLCVYGRPVGVYSNQDKVLLSAIKDGIEELVQLLRQMGR